MHQIISRHCSYVSYGSLFLFILGSIREVSFLLLNLVTIVVLGKTTESPLDSKETKSVNPNGNQPWIFIGRNDAAAEASVLWPTIQRVDSMEKTPMLGKTEGKRRRGRQRMRWSNSITDSADMNLSKLWEAVKDGGAWSATVPEVAKSQTRLSDEQQ